MTDKLLEEIRKRIQDREVGTNGACTHIYIDGEEADSGDIMFLIEKLVEEVEREKSEEIEELKHWLKRYEKDISNAIN